jgi:hypothetical protein
MAQEEDGEGGGGQSKGTAAPIDFIGEWRKWRGLVGVECAEKGKWRFRPWKSPVSASATSLWRGSRSNDAGLPLAKVRLRSVPSCGQIDSGMQGSKMRSPLWFVVRHPYP